MLWWTEIILNEICSLLINNFIEKQCLEANYENMFFGDVKWSFLSSMI